MVGIGPARTASGGNDLLIHSISCSSCTFWYSPMIPRCSLMLATPCTDMAATKPTSKPNWVDLEIGDLPVLVGPGLSLVLSVPLSTADLQLAGVLSELVDTVGGSEDHARSDERSSALEEVDSLGFSSVAGLLLHWLSV